MFAEILNIERGMTAIIGSGGKTSLMLRLAHELQKKSRVIVTTSTHIFPPQEIPVVQELHEPHACVCVGTPCENGKLTAPKQRFEELSLLADYILIEADGSKHLPLKAHLAHEPIIPKNAQVICVVGASGLFLPIEEAVHRHERFFELTGSPIATVEAVALALKTEAFAHRYFINQADGNETAALQLAKLLPKPTVVASLKKGEILCSY